MEAVAGCHADHAGREAHDQEFEREEPEDVGLREAEAAHHRARVEVAQREAPRAGRDRDGRDHRREQCHEREEALGPLDRALHLRTAAFEALHPLPACQLLLEPPA